MSTLADSRAAALQAAFIEAARRNEWGWIADAYYAEDCKYLCEYGGTMRVMANSRAEIKATHYGREMLVGWEGWSFPIERWCSNGLQIITHWWNRGPGTRANGAFFQTPGVSFITLREDGMIVDQLDLFDMAHQMRLCDELDDAGLLSPQLKDNWVRPMKAKLVAMLSR